MFWYLLPVLALLIISALPLLRSRSQLPPGPRYLPLIGNALDLPKAGTPEYEHWAAHKGLYGPISCVSVFGTTLILLNNRETADEVLTKNASKTSGRPTMTFANKMCGYGSLLSSQGYNDTFRRYRKLLHQELGTRQSTAKYSALQELEAQRLLFRVLRSPESLMHHFKT